LRKLISVGAETFPADVLRDYYAELGELEGTTLVRIDAAIEAWRQVLQIDAADAGL